MNIWLVGVGLLGNAVQNELSVRNIPFIATDRAKVNVRDWDEIKFFWNSQGPFTHIVNCSAYTQVDLAEIFHAEAYQMNALGPALLGSLAALKKAKVLHFSTDYVFDGSLRIPYREGDRENPQTVYGKTKWAGEKNLLSVLPHACILRTSWLFGKGKNHFVSTVLQKIQSGEQMCIVSDQWGKPTYAKDLAEISIEALDWEGVYHCANDGIVSWYCFAKKIAEQVGQRSAKIFPILSSDRSSLAPRPSYSVLCTKKIEKRLDRSLRSWESALTEYLKEIHHESS